LESTVFVDRFTTDEKGRKLIVIRSSEGTSVSDLEFDLQTGYLVRLVDKATEGDTLTPFRSMTSVLVEVVNENF
jgi:hypothetical protein